MRIVIFGLSITSAWGNGHATTYRALVRELQSRGHSVLFCERNVPWYANHRDRDAAAYGTVRLYDSVEDARRQFASAIQSADAVIVGSYVPEGSAIARWVLDAAPGVTAFYDIDTPVTVAAVREGNCEYLTRDLAAEFDVYFSFSGGPILQKIKQEFGVRRVVPLYCSFDPASYYHEDTEMLWDLGYLGTYSPDRQPKLNALLLGPARQSDMRFVVAGSQYPDNIYWPPNVTHIDHVTPPSHRHFFALQRFTLNLTRDDMVRSGFSPIVRLFEAAACGVAIISDWWEGLDTFFSPNKEILIAESTNDVLVYLNDLPDGTRKAIGAAARDRVMARHTAAHRAAELENYINEARSGSQKLTEFA